MNREDLSDLSVFAAVAEGQSFTKAATRLGLSQSSVSQIIRRLETRLGVRLVSRTTRSVAPTAAGEQLLSSITPLLGELQSSVEALGRFRDRPAGKLRITATDHAARHYIIPTLASTLAEHSDISVEVMIDYGFVDVVSGRFDAGVRLGDAVEKDMIAVRISPDTPMGIIASPAYLARHAEPKMPQEIPAHRCINLRLPTSERLYDWVLKRRGMTVTVRPEGQMLFNMIGPIIDAARAGIGIAMVPLNEVEDDLVAGRLVRALPEWEQVLPAYHLYYPNRRNASPAFRLMVDALRWRA